MQKVEEQKFMQRFVDMGCQVISENILRYYGVKKIFVF